MTLVEPYLFFDGRCEEAIEFYRRALGAELQFMMRFKESPEPPMVPATSGDRIMHATLKIGESSMMLSDGQCEGKPDFRGFALSLRVKDVAEADRLFGALAEGGKVEMPLTKTFFSPRFGMVEDRFGVGWMVIVQA
jgi:PhnB protein